MKLILLSIMVLFSFPLSSSSESVVKYAALGDSYTVGTGSSPQEAWPSLLVDRLQKKGEFVKLVANLARNGWTTQDMINYELPVLDQIRPDIVTILIGVNDWVQGVHKEMFTQHVHLIFESLLAIMPAQSILVVTIPDFSVTPFGSQYSNGRDISKGIAEFNQVLIKEASSFGIKLVDLYPLSKGMGEDRSLVAPDGLHPSAKEHVKWADLVEPEFSNLVLKAKK